MVGLDLGDTGGRVCKSYPLNSELLPLIYGDMVIPVKFLKNTLSHPM
jgi:hypothetical protein